MAGRCAIASHVKQGWKVKVICLSYGERGESAKLWRKPDMTLEQVKTARQEEAQKAAGTLGPDSIGYDPGFFFQ